MGRLPLSCGLASRLSGQLSPIRGNNLFTSIHPSAGFPLLPAAESPGQIPGTRMGSSKENMKSVKSLKREADKKLQEKVVRDNPRCLLCGDRTFAGHHFIFKSQSNNLRYYQPNLVPVCIKCHYKIHHRQDPEIINKIIRIKGQAWADDLYSRRHTICKMNKGYLKDILKELNE